MKILIASTPATGHLNPLLAIGRILIAESHEVAFLSGSALRSGIEGIGAPFHAFPAGADFDLRDIPSVVPEIKDLPPGPEWLRVILERVFIDPVPAQHKGLQQILRDFPADVIIGARQTKLSLRASLMTDDFNDIDTRSEVLRIVSQVLHPSGGDDLRRGEVAAKKESALGRV
jgi:hypothetical protein